jgi:hypothetical protein
MDAGGSFGSLEEDYQDVSSCCCENATFTYALIRRCRDILRYIVYIVMYCDGHRLLLDLQCMQGLTKKSLPNATGAGLSTEELEELHKTDPKRVKRILANRSVWSAPADWKYKAFEPSTAFQQLALIIIRDHD